MDENELLKKLSELKPPIIINDLKDLYIETDMFMKKITMCGSFIIAKEATNT